MKIRFPIQKGIISVALGTICLFSLFCTLNIIWMQSNTQIEGVITTPELFIQRDTSTVVISSHEITHALEEYIEDYDFGIYFDIPSNYWRTSYFNKLQYRFISNSNQETILMLYIEEPTQALNGYSYDSIEHIHWSSNHNEPPEPTYAHKAGEELSPDFSSSIQIIASSTGRNENTLDFRSEYEDFSVVIYSLGDSDIETRLSLGVKMPIFSLLRNILLLVSCISGVSAMFIYSKRGGPIE